MIIVRTAGGMGNQMFQYATGRAISLRYDVPLKLDNYVQQYLHTHPPKVLSMVFREYSLDVFCIKADIAKKSDIPWWLRFYGFGKLEPFIDGIRRRLIRYKGRENGSAQVYHSDILAIGPSAYLDGDWQSYRYFENIRDVLLQDFQLKRPPTEAVEHLALDITSSESVCLHVRRGDYVGNTFHGLKDQTYYDQALQKIRSLCSIDTIFVFSDDIEWCRANLSFEYRVMFVGPEFAGERDSGHFHLMRSCKHFIICNSSFSWWAAWLAEGKDKIVIAPKKWFLDVSIDTTDLIPKNWIQL